MKPDVCADPIFAYDFTKVAQSFSIFINLFPEEPFYEKCQSITNFQDVTERDGRTCSFICIDLALPYSGQENLTEFKLIPKCVYAML